MEKNKFLDEVKKHGYEALIDGGVVIVKYPGKFESGIKEIRALAEKLDYNQSWGLRIVSADYIKASNKVSEAVAAAEADEPEEIEPVEGDSNSDISDGRVNPADTDIKDEAAEDNKDSLDDSNEAYLDDDFLDDGDDLLSDIDSFKQISLFDID